MDLVNLFSTATGVNNWVDNVRLPADRESGVVDLLSGVNIHLDKTGRPSRRGGYVLRESGEFHSIFATEHECYLGIGTYLYRVAPDLALVGVRGEMSGARISFCNTSRGILYTTGTNFGRLNAGASSQWIMGEYVGPPTTRQFSGPPEGLGCIELHGGRIFGAVGNALVWSEPFHHDLWAPATNFLQLSTEVVMVKTVDTGLYVSDQKKTYFLPGTDPQEFDLKHIAADQPALKWSALSNLITPVDLGREAGPGYAVWLSPTGLAYGSTTGVVDFPTRSRITVPQGFRSGAIVRDGQNLIYVMFDQ